MTRIASWIGLCGLGLGYYWNSNPPEWLWQMSDPIVGLAAIFIASMLLIIGSFIVAKATKRVSLHERGAFWISIVFACCMVIFGMR